MSEKPEVIFNNLLEKKEFEKVVELCESPEYSNFKQRNFFQGLALKQLGSYTDALSSVNVGLESNPESLWGINLKYSILKELSIEDALSFVYSVLSEEDVKSESLLTEAINDFVKFGDFNSASILNEKRSVLCDISAQDYCICIQAFNKPDTIRSLFDSLLKCDGKSNFHVILLQDTYVNSRKPDDYKPKVEEVKNVIFEYAPSLSSSFYSFEYHFNEVNMGTAPTCRKLLEIGASRFKGFLFLEDDCILARDSLVWTRFALDNLITEQGAHFATCESVFFDHSRGEPPKHEDLLKIKEIAQNLNSSFCKLGFVPSTCFITLSSLWDRYKSLRSFPKGPESLNKYFESINGKTVFPIVPRVSDIGMEHEDGYSTLNLGKGNVKEIKSTYLTSDIFSCDSNFEQYRNSLDLLYSATSKLNEKHIEKCYSTIVQKVMN